MTEPSAAPVSPSESPDAWEQLGLAEFTWPLPSDTGAGPRKCGAVHFKDFDVPKLKTDKQKASGTDKAKTKVSGVEVGEDEFELHWTRWNDKASWAMLKLFLPGGARKGQPQEVRHPFFDFADVHRIIIVEMKVSIQGDTRKAVVKWEEWNEPPAAVAGATTTPKDASQWTGGANAPVEAFTPAKGFGGAGAPATSP